MAEKKIDFDKLDPKQWIIIKGAKVHNLKNISLAMPRGKFIVITGLSGSGKSSLAFDTLYAEGQRRYVESLSAYARQFLGRLNKPEVEYIKGISPAIAIEQKVISRNPRSTVGTTSEIYDYIKLLYARIGKTYSPVSGNQVKRHTVQDVMDYLNNLKNGERFLIVAPIFTQPERPLREQLKLLLQQGYTRITFKGKVLSLEDFLLDPIKGNEVVGIVVDRFQKSTWSEEDSNRLSDSIQIAFAEGHGNCHIAFPDSTKTEQFSNLFELDDMVFEEPTSHFFSFNNPVGACKTCEGYGSVIGIDHSLVVPDPSKSIFDEAIVCWKGDKMQEYKKQFLRFASKIDFPVHRPYQDLNKKQLEILWNGQGAWEGINGFFKFIESQTYKIQYRVMLARYRGKTTCPDCLGTRLRKDAQYVKIQNLSIAELVLMPIEDLVTFFSNLKLTEFEKKVSKRLMVEINSRLQFLIKVGLGYLNLNRLSNTLSGGESQRINLATSLGSSLVGSMYILDEPSIGLHPRDTLQLIGVLKTLKEIGNTVIVVEHDEEIMRAADEIIDIGPLAGTGGGELIFQGPITAIKNNSTSLTARYLNKTDAIPVPSSRRGSKSFIEIIGATENNLKNINVRFPLKCLIAVTGVSGSGKSSLIKRILYPAIKKIKGDFSEFSGKHNSLKGDLDSIYGVEFVDQNPIGKSSRSNPVTYIKAYDEIRNLFAEVALSKARGYKPAHFSFNVDGGRCDTCQGDGTVTIGMQFMADLELTCESCQGKRFKPEILEVQIQGKSITDILTMTVDDAIVFFNGLTTASNQGKKIATKLHSLSEVGLGYIQLGQASSTLSGGEAQRIKLASFLGTGTASHQPMLFIFDEPTTGLHFHDIHKLMHAFEALLQYGHSIIVIEHNMEVIKCADWVIDIGPEGGEKGGQLLFEGTPEDLCKVKTSHTGKYLKKILNEISA